MTDLQPYLWIAAGVAVSILLPVLSGMVRKKFPKAAAPGLPLWVRKYGALFLFSLVTALVVLAFYRSQNPASTILWYQAFLAGYAWEATIEKLAG